MSATKKVLTVERDFLQATIDGDFIFSVKSGVDLASGFDQLAILIQGCIGVVNLAISSDDGEAVSGAMGGLWVQLEGIYALTRSIQDAYHEAQKSSQDSQ